MAREGVGSQNDAKRTNFELSGTMYSSGPSMKYMSSSGNTRTQLPSQYNVLHIINLQPNPCTGRIIPKGSELANMVANDAKVAKLAANLVTKNDANLALPPRFRQVLIESPL
ncbi:hypothetical protein TNCV_3564151 [Trichonephila clavipes]|nr:hypothetical protein TNCV_3564151 [Trichonephila clavipes]